MENNTLNPHKKIGLEIQNKNSDNQSPYFEKKIDKIFPIWLAGNYSYCDPFMSMVDISFVIDALKKIFKEWLTFKNKLMNYIKTVPILVTMLLLWSSSFNAQQTENVQSFNLDEMWKVAEANNRTLKLSDLSLQQSALEVLEAKDRLLPELSLGGDVKLNSKFLIYDNGLFASPQDVPVKEYGYVVGYNLNFNLFNGGKDRRNIAIKKEEETRKGYEFELQKHNVKYNVAVAYFDLYKLLHFYDFLDAEIETEKKQLSLIESLHKNGIVLKSDVLRTSVKLSQLELNISEVEKKIAIAKQRLNILMGRDNEAELTISYENLVESESIKPSDYNDYLNIAFTNSPEYKMVNSDIKLSELNINQVKASILPKVALYSNYNYTYPQISFYPYSNDLWGFGQTGIKIQFSIDNLYKSKHSIARSKMVSDQAKEKAEIRKDEISLQVKEVCLEEQQALEIVETAEKNMAKTTETVRVIRSSYLNQESLLTDLLEAENALLEAKFNLTSAQTNVQLTHIRLLAIVGIL